MNLQELYVETPGRDRGTRHLTNSRRARFIECHPELRRQFAESGNLMREFIRKNRVEIDYLLKEAR